MLACGLRQHIRSLKAAVRAGAASFKSTFAGCAPKCFPIGLPGLGGFVDSVLLDPCGIIRIVGWSKSAFDPRLSPAVWLDGQPVPFLQHFRFARPDAGENPDSLCPQAGLALDYLAPESLAGTRIGTLSIALQPHGDLVFEADFTFINPHYRQLLDTPRVLHREEIYGSGPPNTAVHPEVLTLAMQLEGPVLDLGCGRGVLVGELRRAGIEAHGLELDSELIRQCIPAGRSGDITLYDGAFPSPFPDRAFRSVICSEVLEHIPDYRSAVRDIARLCSGKVIFTVPDASAIPVGFHHGAVPWHLLEGTHVNFFTQESLKRVLEPHFSRIEFGRIGLARFNDSTYYVSLVASCMA